MTGKFDKKMLSKWLVLEEDVIIMEKRGIRKPYRSYYIQIETQNDGVGLWLLNQ